MSAPLSSSPKCLTCMARFHRRTGSVFGATIRRKYPWSLGAVTSSAVTNGRTQFEQASRLVQVLPRSAPVNYLAFVASEFGTSYAVHDRFSGRVSLFQIQPDYFFRDGRMAALGRISLWRILNASPRVRLVVEYTASLNSDRENRIPPARAIGQERYTFTVEGRGSARLFSSPMLTQSIDGGEYVLLDMGTWGFRFPERRSWIMSLYGNDVLSDPRRIVGFTRDISLISNKDYENLLRLQSGDSTLPDRFKQQGSGVLWHL